MAVLLLGLGVVSQLAGRTAQIHVRLRKAGSQFDRTPKARNSRRAVALGGQRVASIEVSFGGMRIEREGLLVARERFVIVLEFGERGAKIQVGVHQRWIERHGLAILTHRAFDARLAPAA